VREWFRTFVGQILGGIWQEAAVEAGHALRRQHVADDLPRRNLGGALQLDLPPAEYQVSLLADKVRRQSHRVVLACVRWAGMHRLRRTNSCCVRRSHAAMLQMDTS
jgi:hypothetical protein